jgi:NAD-dependent deacetylase
LIVHTTMAAIPTELVNALRHARRVTVLTGAGISAESGIPTFRQAQTGLWNRYHPEELATPEAFERNPQLVWEWYVWRRQLVAQSQPNAGHAALVVMQAHVPEWALITQNVDGLHQRAGSHGVIELHGNLMRYVCRAHRHVVSVDEPAVGMPPLCPACGSLVRPDVVWFGESLPPAALDAAFTAATSCEVFLSVGTSAVVQPAASLPIQALASGALTVEINPDETPLSRRVSFVVRGPAGQVLPALVHAAWPDSA